MPEARDPELEALILEDPEDPEAYLVYADWLQGAGDPRGKLITAQAALAAAPGSEALAAAAAAILAEHRESLLGSHVDGEPFSFEWRCGFWRGAKGGGFGWTARAVTEEHVAQLVAAPSARFLRRVSCTGPLGPEVLGLFAPLARTLRDLEVSVSPDRFEDPHLLALRPLAELRRLVLFPCRPLTGRGLQALASLPHLEALYLHECPLSDEHARGLAGLQLTRVRFDTATPAFTWNGMSTLAAAPLRALHLPARSFDDSHVVPLAGHATLADLELAGARITAFGAEILGSLPRLRRLRIPECTLSDRGACKLAPLAGSLQVLHLGRSKAIADVACEALSTFDRLVFLDVSSTRVTGAGARMLGRLPRLEHLSLGFLDVGDEATGALASLASLRSLSLRGCTRITDGAIDALARIPRLERLDLSGTSITERGIAQLAAAPHLHELGLRDCDRDAIARAHRLDRWSVETQEGLYLHDDSADPP